MKICEVQANVDRATSSEKQRFEQGHAVSRQNRESSKNTDRSDFEFPEWMRVLVLMVLNQTLDEELWSENYSLIKCVIQKKRLEDSSSTTERQWKSKAGGWF